MPAQGLYSVSAIHCMDGWQKAVCFLDCLKSGTKEVTLAESTAGKNGKDHTGERNR